MFAEGMIKSQVIVFWDTVYTQPFVHNKVSP